MSEIPILGRLDFGQMSRNLAESLDSLTNIILHTVFTIQWSRLVKDNQSLDCLESGRVLILDTCCNIHNPFSFFNSHIFLTNRKPQLLAKRQLTRRRTPNYRLGKPETQIFAARYTPRFVRPNHTTSR